MPPVWEWSGYNSHGRQSGKTLADSKEELKANLPGLLLTRLRPIRPSRPKALSAPALARMTRLMAIMASSGMPFSAVVGQLLAQAASVRERDLLAAIATDLAAGRGLHGAFQRRGLFSPMYLSVLKACEEGGDKRELLGLLADTLERNSQFARRLAGAVVYPIILLLSGLGAAYLMAVLVVPSMRSVLGDELELPALTRVLFAISDAVTGWRPGPGTALLLVAAVLLRRRLVGVLSPLAGWLPAVRLMHLARAAAVLQLLVRGGVPVTRALLIAGRGCHLRLKRVLEKAVEDVEAGASLSQAFAANPVLPPLWARLTATGEASGDYDRPFAMLASLHGQALERQMATITRIAEPLLVLLTGGLLTLILLGLYLPVLQAGTAF